MRNFKNYEIWIDSIELTDVIYDICESFPKNELYQLGSQMERAVVSIPSNIAEGTSKASPREQFHFIEIAYGSLMEIMCQAEIAFDQHYITQDNLTLIEEKIVSIYKMLSSMQSTLKSRIQGNHL